MLFISVQQKEICLLDYRNQKIDESETVMAIDKLATEKERKTQGKYCTMRIIYRYK